MAIRSCGECPCLTKKTEGGSFQFYEVYWCKKFNLRKDPKQESCSIAKEKGENIKC